MSQALTLARPYARAAFALARDAGRIAEWSQRAGVRSARVAADPQRARPAGPPAAERGRCGFAACRRRAPTRRSPASSRCWPTTAASGSCRKSPACSRSCAPTPTTWSRPASPPPREMPASELDIDHGRAQAPLRPRGRGRDRGRRLADRRRGDRCRRRGDRRLAQGQARPPAVDADAVTRHEGTGNAQASPAPVPAPPYSFLQQFDPTATAPGRTRSRNLQMATTAQPLRNQRTDQDPHREGQAGRGSAQRRHRHLGVRRHRAHLRPGRRDAGRNDRAAGVRRRHAPSRWR